MFRHFPRLSKVVHFHAWSARPLSPSLVMLMATTSRLCPHHLHSLTIPSTSHTVINSATYRIASAYNHIKFGPCGISKSPIRIYLLLLTFGPRLFVCLKMLDPHSNVRPMIDNRMHILPYCDNVIFIIKFMVDLLKNEMQKVVLLNETNLEILIFRDLHWTYHQFSIFCLLAFFTINLTST
jgi:hypothetical protein